MKIQNLLSIIIFVFIFNDSFCQCSNQVFHFKGSMTVNKVSILVTSTGVVDTFPDYCKAFPYLIGRVNSSSTNGNGSYSFNFTPTVNSITLNFSGISLTAKHKEEIVLFVNGVHYRIPSAGSLSDCEPMAVLNANGNINGCFDCGVSGWFGTTIKGPIYSLTVLDSVISGAPNGTTFALFMCESVSIINAKQSINLNNFFPNPFTLRTMLNLPETVNNVEVLLINAQGSIVKPIYSFENSVVVLERGNLASGIYYYRIMSNTNILAVGKLMIN